MIEEEKVLLTTLFIKVDVSIKYDSNRSLNVSISSSLELLISFTALAILRNLCISSLSIPASVA